MNEKLDVRRGSGNVFRDHGDPDANTKQLKARLAAEIIGVLNERGWSTRKAQKELGVDQSDIVRIRNADLARFTIDRLVRVLGKLNLRVDVKVRKTEKTKAA